MIVTGTITLARRFGEPKEVFDFRLSGVKALSNSIADLLVEYPEGTQFWVQGHKEKRSAGPQFIRRRGE